MRPPFQERNSPARGILDLVTGCYPGFLFGGSLGDWLPVFHFHESHPDAVESYFLYLAENGYRTVNSDAIADLVHRGIHPGPKHVALCFDDAWASMWLVIFPLLQKYQLNAITFVSPARVPDAPSPRTPWPNMQGDASKWDRTPPMFSTWPELRAMAASGYVDIQAHSNRHAQIPSFGEVIDFYKPGQIFHPHEVPWVATPDGSRFLQVDEVGAPLYPTRSRLSDARRWLAPETHAACLDFVKQHGGENFFQQPDWRQRLGATVAKAPPGRWESEEEQHAAIWDELVTAREALNAGLHSTKVKHLCFPWAIAGRQAVELAREAGYETAFSDRLFGARSVRAGDPPFQLMRLKHTLIPCLPGKGRSWFFGRRWPSASRGMQLSNLPPPAAPASIESVAS